MGKVTGVMVWEDKHIPQPSLNGLIRRQQTSNWWDKLSVCLADIICS